MTKPIVANESKENLALSKNNLIEGIHFYKESGYMVFTEIYHKLRGTCCQSGCRHCPYGYKKRKSM